MNYMDRMERFKVEASIKDAIAILDSAPMRRDLVHDFNLVQLTNRAPIAHLATERGLKALINDPDKTRPMGHWLNKLFRYFGQRNKDSATFLAVAFQDAVIFFGYNVNINGFGHFRSLEDYLAKVGTQKVFEDLRYWAIEPPKGKSHIQLISLPIHRELLYALRNLVMGRGADTVSARVEREVKRAMFYGGSIAYLDGDTRTERSVGWYKNWLFETHATCSSALQEAVRCNFAVKDDESVTRILRDAYGELLQSKDPAVQYFVSTLTDLPEGSQPRIPDAIPEMKWLRENQSGVVETPAGTPLGFIERFADGRWGIEPLEEGLVQLTEVAKSTRDAKFYLVNRLTSEVAVAVNGEARKLRIVGQKYFLPDADWNSVEEVSRGMGHTAIIYRLEFWDARHGLRPGEQVSVSLPFDGASGFVSVLEGTIRSVEGQKVSIVGVIVGMSAESVGCDGVSD